MTESSTVAEITILVRELSPLITAIGILFTSVISVMSLMKQNQTHKLTNSMKDELVKVVGESEHAKGVIAGAEQQKIEDHDKRKV